MGNRDETRASNDIKHTTHGGWSDHDFIIGSGCILVGPFSSTNHVNEQ